MRIFNLVEFNSFKIFFLIKTRAMMNDTETITLQTLILRTRRKEKEIIRATRSKTSILGARYFCQKRAAL